MRTVLKTDKAPAAIGPYSQGIATDNLVFVSGQIPVDPETGKMADDISAQTKQVMENLRAVLAAAKTDLSRVVKSTIFLTDINDFSNVNAVYASYFDEAPPARSTVAVAALPLGAKVEIEVIALRTQDSPDPQRS